MSQAIRSDTASEGFAMSSERIPHNRPVFDHLPPNVYRTATAMVVWFVVAAWALFDRQGYTGFLLAMITLLLFIAVTLPWLLSRIGRKRAQDQSPEPSFQDWRFGDFAVWGSRIRGAHAAIDMLLPFVAAAVGMTLIGIVFAIES
jgi:hypothetical protein